MSFHHSIPAGQLLDAGWEPGTGQGPWCAEDPASGEALKPEFSDAGPEQVDRACRAAADAAPALSALAPQRRARLLEAMATALEARQAALAEITPRETGLPEARVRSELTRTTGQLRLFAALVEDGLFLDARLDAADPQRRPLPRPEVRSCHLPLGPVAVFGAANFPLAFSVAGGDTASALAAGCPVVVKAHPAHPATSALVADALAGAVREAGLPPGVLTLVHGRTQEVGAALVSHPAVRAVAFTGSFRGGRALVEVAARRPEPIPVMAEMGSLNPLFLLPGALQARGEAIAEGLAASLTLGSGQFCTNPGLVFAPAGPALDAFLEALAGQLAELPAGVMLHRGILGAYQAGLARLQALDGVELAAAGPEAPGRGQARVHRVELATFRGQPELLEELFGPSTVVVALPPDFPPEQVAAGLPGQLAAAVHGTDRDLAAAGALVEALTARAGRVLFNGFPTGVEVGHAMVHGGPWPATSDARFTSVGTRAVERFLRPVAFQDCPDALLPPPLQEANPWDVPRRRDGGPPRR